MAREFFLSPTSLFRAFGAVARSEFATDVEAGRLSIDGKQLAQPVHFDGSKMEKMPGIKFAPFHEPVRQVAGQYLDLLDQA